MEQIAVTAVLIGGVYHLLFGIFHFFFPFALRWKDTVASLDGTNRNLLPVFNFWIAAAILGWSYTSLAHAREIASTPLGHAVCWTIAAVWTLRHMMQVYYMGVSGTYRFPRRFLGLQGIHCLVFTPIFSLGTALYLTPILRDDPNAWLAATATIAGLLVASGAVRLWQTPAVVRRTDRSALSRG